MYRGRMVARLRGRVYTLKALQIAVELSDDVRFTRLVDALVAEGMIVRKGGILLLR